MLETLLYQSHGAVEGLQVETSHEIDTAWQVLKLCAPEWPFGKVAVLREVACR